MPLDYLSEQSQFREFMFELDRLFVKYHIDNVYVVNNSIQFQRGDDDGWFFGSWLLKKDGVRRFSRPGINENRFNQCSAAMYAVHADAVKKSDTKNTIAPATIEPLVEEPELKGTIVVPEATVIRTDPTGTETLSVTKIKADIQDNKQDNMEDNKQVMGNLSYSEEAEPELIEQEINPKIEEYINDLADRLYTTAKSMGFPKNVLGEYWTHPKVVMAVKKAGFNESAYMIISANTTYWHKLAARMKEVEMRDKEQNKQENTAKSVVAAKVAEAVAELEPVSHMETFSTDTILGTWTIKYSDYPASVYLDSKKGIDSICSKAYNWLLIYTRMHPELSPFPTRAMLCEALKDNMKRKKSFSYKWYEFALEVDYNEPIEGEETDNA